MLETFWLGIFILLYLVFIKALELIKIIKMLLIVGTLELPKALGNHLLSSKVFVKSLRKLNAFESPLFWYKV